MNAIQSGTRLLGAIVASVAMFGILPAVTHGALIEGNNNSNCLEGTSSADTMRGFGGVDSIWGFNGNDTINGGNGNDGGGATCYTTPSSGGGLIPGLPFRLVGGSGNDTIYGGDGNDDLVGNSGVDGLFGNSGNDRIWASGDGSTSDTVRGGAGYDICYVTASDNVQGCELINP